MAFEIYVEENLNKNEKYAQLLPQIKSLVENETDLIANLANICAALKYTMNFLWVGFYRVEGEELVLSVFQGPVACTRFSIQKGVCGACVRQKQPIIVPNVHLFEGHIACNHQSNSEIVIPVLKNGTVSWVLDIDSEHFDCFDEADVFFLQKILELVF
ncbi:MAG: GAF domain-containing protein [Bacteroidia bacterium]|nr:GAF domain-containing protein [Bacteroidia bacterium]MDW8303204.1 GAF domain-containing protein [Bacteroidia bacterium]